MKDDQNEKDKKIPERPRHGSECPASIRDVEVLQTPLTKRETFGLGDIRNKKDK